MVHGNYGKVGPFTMICRQWNRPSNQIAPLLLHLLAARTGRMSSFPWFHGTRGVEHDKDEETDETGRAIWRLYKARNGFRTY